VAEILVRHSVMPGHIECCSKPILCWLAQNAPHAAVNIMGQYRPAYKVTPTDYPELARRVSGQEMHEVKVFAQILGIKLI